MKIRVRSGFRTHNINPINRLILYNYYHHPHVSDVHSRWSVSRCASAAYLTTGLPLAHQEVLVAHNININAQQTAELLPVAYNPLALHSAAPLQLPVSHLRGGGSGADLADQQWSRRQFSVLWAPMPADYSMDDDNGGNKKVR